MSIEQMTATNCRFGHHRKMAVRKSGSKAGKPYAYCVQCIKKAAQARKLRTANALWWIKRATSFVIRPDVSGYEVVKITRRVQQDQTTKWAVENGAQVMSRLDGTWLYEPMPSNRTDEFIALTRFNTKEEALRCFESFYRNTGARR